MLIRRWKRWLKTINNDIVSLNHQRHIFREIAESFRTKLALQTDATVWNWLAGNYATTTAVGVRRQIDRRKDVISLERLLTEIAENPAVLTRSWFERQYVRGKPPLQRASYQKMAERDFQRFAGRSAKQISARMVVADRAKLRKTAARLRHYVNKRVAHRARSGYRGPATFADLNAAVDELASLLQKYSLLLNQAGMISVEPVIQGDWEAVLRVPWKP